MSKRFPLAAVVRCAQQSFPLSTSFLDNSAPSPFLRSLLQSAFLSTATAAPEWKALGTEDLQPATQSNTASGSQPSARGAQAAASPTAVAGSSLAALPSAAPHTAASAAAAAAQPEPAAPEEPLPAPNAADLRDGALAATSQAPLLQVVPTPEGPPRDKLLLRDFIQNSLYHPTLGYFNAPTPPVGSVGSPINYWRIYCRDEFNILVKKKYEELQTSFLTPAELFSPWYGACIARHIVEHRRHHLAMEGQPLHIVEVGGGNGTLARDVLDWLRANRPQDYSLTSYTCLEISTSLAARQYDKVVRQGGHGGRFHLRRGSGLDPATWGPPGSRVWDHTFVLMMEVLDNLPHDRVFRRRASDPWQQTVVRLARSSSSPSSTSSIEHGPWEEVGEPVSDPLVRRTLAAVYRNPTREEQLDERFNRVLDFILARDAQPTSRDEILWLPTACTAFLELLHNVRPNHSLIAADFDKLPDVRLPGRNAPLVAQKVGGRNIDHDTLLVPWGTADIFFPTDFTALCSLYRAAAEHVWGPGSEAAAAAAATPAAAAGTPLPPPPGTVPGTAAVAPAPSSPESLLGEVNAEHFRQGAVVKRYREMFNTATICAFNPMVDDFVNARFFFGDSKNRYPPGQPRPVQGKRLPTVSPALTSAIKSHIPAAPASKVRARAQQYQQQITPQHQQHPQHPAVQPQRQEPLLGGKRHRGSNPGAGQGQGGER